MNKTCKVLFVRFVRVCRASFTRGDELMFVIATIAIYTWPALFIPAGTFYTNRRLRAAIESWEARTTMPRPRASRSGGGRRNTNHPPSNVYRYSIDIHKEIWVVLLYTIFNLCCYSLVFNNRDIGHICDTNILINISIKTTIVRLQGRGNGYYLSNKKTHLDIILS